MARLDRMVEKARFGTYFECLDLPNDAATSDVRAAHERLLSEVDAVRPLAGLSDEMTAAVSEVSQVIEDAYDVLVDPDSRLAYRRAIES